MFTSILSTVWLSASELEREEALAEMMTDVHRRAVMLAPVDTSNLVNSGQITRVGEQHYKVTFGNAQVPYARRRHFENKKNPQTLGYLAKAGDGVVRGDTKKYFRIT